MHYLYTTKHSWQRLIKVSVDIEERYAFYYTYYGKEITLPYATPVKSAPSISREYNFLYWEWVAAGTRYKEGEKMTVRTEADSVLLEVAFEFVVNIWTPVFDDVRDEEEVVMQMNEVYLLKNLHTTPEGVGKMRFTLTDIFLEYIEVNKVTGEEPITRQFRIKDLIKVVSNYEDMQGYLEKYDAPWGGKVDVRLSVGGMDLFVGAFVDESDPVFERTITSMTCNLRRVEILKETY